MLLYQSPDFAPPAARAAAHCVWGSALPHRHHHPPSATPSPDTSSESRSQIRPLQGLAASYLPTTLPIANPPTAPSLPPLRWPREPATATPSAMSATSAGALHQNSP